MVLMKVLANIAVNLQAAGPAATLIAWIVGVTLLGIFGGDGTVAKSAISALTVVGIILVIAFAQPPSR